MVHNVKYCFWNVACTYGIWSCVSIPGVAPIFYTWKSVSIAGDTPHSVFERVYPLLGHPLHPFFFSILERVSTDWTPPPPSILERVRPFLGQPRAAAQRCVDANSNTHISLSTLVFRWDLSPYRDPVVSRGQCPSPRPPSARHYTWVRWKGMTNKCTGIHWYWHKQLLVGVPDKLALLCRPNHLIKGKSRAITLLAC